MAQEVCIVDESVSGESPSVTGITRTYNIKEYTTYDAAVSALLSSPACPTADAVYTTLVRDKFSVNPVENVDGDDYWTGTVNWKEFIPPTLGREILSGTISSSTQRIKATYNHVGSYGPGGGQAMNAGGGINVTSDGVEGVDISIPVLSFAIQREYAKGTFTLAWLANAMTYANKPNNASWRGFGIGTVMLTNVTGTDDGKQFDSITFNFEASPTFTNLVIPSPLGNITIPSKLGWQYLHIQYLHRYDTATGLTYPVPHTAHVDELTPGVNLNTLI